jgi:type VI protein secretion system component VasA
METTHSLLKEDIWSSNQRSREGAGDTRHRVREGSVRTEPNDLAEEAGVIREHFEREVDYFWQRLRRLAERYPRLEAHYARNADSRVSRLVQSAAFAFASVHERLDEDAQALVRPLVAAALPECLRPRPASTILQLTQSTNSTGALFFGRAGAVELPFEVMWPVHVASIDLSNVWVERVHAGLQVLRMTIAGRSNVVLGTVLPEVLRVFVRFERPALAFDLIHALRRATSRIRVRCYDTSGGLSNDTELPPGTLQWPRVDSDERSLVSAPVDRFRSSTLLRDLYAFPESFCFFDLRLSGLRQGTLGRLELALPLAGVVEGVKALGSENLLLGCGPASNQYKAAMTPLRPAGTERCWSVGVAGRPHAEVLHVLALRRVDPHDAQHRREVLSWEAPAAPPTFEPGNTYFLLEQEIGPSDSRTDLRVSFATLDGFDQALPGVLVEGDVLASDGELANELGFGDIGRTQGAANVTRVAPSRRAVLGQNHAWRMNAYARMPPVRFATSSYLHEFLGLHDSSDARDESARVQVPRFTRTAHARVHRLVDGMLEWGDSFSLNLDAPQASAGEAWLICELLSRAIAERNERLRFSRLVVTRDGEHLADFSPRQGVRLPFPLG